MRRDVRLIGISISAAFVFSIIAVLAIPSLGPAAVMVSTGDSMGMDDPQLVFTADISPSVGDTVVWEAGHYGDKLTRHTVIAETEHGYQTKGDANPVPDQSKEAGVWQERLDFATDENMIGTEIYSMGLYESLIGWASLSIAYLFWSVRGRLSDLITYVRSGGRRTNIKT